MTDAARIPVVYGVVLAGGRSRRMGRDKAGIVMGKQTLLARAVEVLQARLPQVLVSARADQQSDSLRRAFDWIPDQVEGIGPAAGILAAHEFAPEAAWLVLACDMPAVSGSLIDALLAGRDPDAAATAFTRAPDAAPEPLCAIYEPGTLADFAAHVAAGGSASPRNWLENADTYLIVSTAGQALQSVNTEEDLSNLEPMR